MQTVVATFDNCMVNLPTFRWKFAGLQHLQQFFVYSHDS